MILNGPGIRPFQIQEEVMVMFGVDLEIDPGKIANMKKKDFVKENRIFYIIVDNKPISLLPYQKAMQHFYDSYYYQTLKDDEELFPGFLEAWGFVD